MKRAGCEVDNAHWHWTEKAIGPINLRLLAELNSNVVLREDNNRVRLLIGEEAKGS